MSIILNIDQLPIRSDESYGCETIYINDDNIDDTITIICDYCNSPIQSDDSYYHYIFTDINDYCICKKCHQIGINFCSYSDQLFDKKDTFKLHNNIYIHKQYSDLFDDFSQMKQKQEYLESVGIYDVYNNRILIEPAKVKTKHDSESEDGSELENKTEIHDCTSDNIKTLLNNI